MDTAGIGRFALLGTKVGEVIDLIRDHLVVMTDVKTEDGVTVQVDKIDRNTAVLLPIEEGEMYEVIRTPAGLLSWKAGRYFRIERIERRPGGHAAVIARWWDDPTYTWESSVKVVLRRIFRDEIVLMEELELAA